MLIRTFRTGLAGCLTLVLAACAMAPEQQPTVQTGRAPSSYPQTAAEGSGPAV